MKTYHIWSPGDPVLETLPENCEQLSVNECWIPCLNFDPTAWECFHYRWPAEPIKQRPTAFGLLSEEEQAEIREAKKLGNVEWLASCELDGPVWKAERPGEFGPVSHVVYRIKEPTPQERYNFKVTVNGEEIDPKSMSKSSWMNLRGGE